MWKTSRSFHHNWSLCLSLQAADLLCVDPSVCDSHVCSVSVELSFCFVLWWGGYICAVYLFYLLLSSSLFQSHSILQNELSKEMCFHLSFVWDLHLFTISCIPFLPCSVNLHQCYFADLLVSKLCATTYLFCIILCSMLNALPQLKWFLLQMLSGLLLNLERLEIFTKLNSTKNSLYLRTLSTVNGRSLSWPISYAKTSHRSKNKVEGINLGRW